MFSRPARHALLGAAFLLFALSGCQWFRNNILHNGDKSTALQERPTKESLAAYLNRESARIQSIQVNNLAMEASLGMGLRSVGLNGTLQAQKPRNFRLEGYIPGARSDMVDVGSNDREFWFWVGDGGRGGETPALYHCSHSDLPKAQLPLPIYPEWIMEALGMGSVEPQADLRVEFARDGKTFDLIEATRSPQGKPVYKVTTFNARTVSGPEPQIRSRKLLDANMKLICQADIEEMQQLPDGIAVPRRVTLVYPGERRLDQITLKLVMDTVAVNMPIDPAMASIWFTRPQKPGVLALDLAKLQPANTTFRNPPPGPTIRGRSR
jgi:hypothetical protein